MTVYVVPKSLKDRKPEVLSSFRTKSSQIRFTKILWKNSKGKYVEYERGKKLRMEVRYQVYSRSKSGKLKWHTKTSKKWSDTELKKRWKKVTIEDINKKEKRSLAQKIRHKRWGTQKPIIEIIDGQINIWYPWIPRSRRKGKKKNKGRKKRK